ncbi:MAG: AbrB/MazE/SpoVT family DNA-binding domain-containing protein [Acutalibacteraceae bacterium]
MIIKMLKKSQITIPKKFVNDLGLKEGDQFKVSLADGALVLEPVAVYPKAYVEELKEELADIKKKMPEDDIPSFTSVSDRFNNSGK